MILYNGQALQRSSRARRLASLALLTTLSCGSRATSDPARLRLGYFPNVTHAVALTAMRRETFAKALAPVTIEWRAFSAGPQAIEALYAGAVDACYVGPGPATNGYLRSRGEALVILAGAASGGAALVVRRDLHASRPEDLHGKTLATPQLGNTQDVALRGWLMDQQLDTVERGGDIKVLPIAGAQALVLMKRGELDGAWVPEPWVSRLVKEAGGEVLVDERDLWPDGRFATAVLVGARPALAAKREALGRLVRAHVEEVAWIGAHRDEARALVGESIESVTGKALPAGVLEAAFARVEVTWDPLPPSVLRMAASARRLRYLPEGDLSALIDRSLLDAALLGRPAP